MKRGGAITRDSRGKAPLKSPGLPRLPTGMLFKPPTSSPFGSPEDVAKAVGVPPTNKVAMREIQDQLQGQRLGRFKTTDPATGKVVSRSARLNPELAAADLVVSELTEGEIDGILGELSSKLTGGARRQRGGGWWDDIKTDVAGKYAAVKTLVVWSMAASGKLGSEAAKKVSEATGVNGETAKKYLLDNYADPLLKMGGRLAAIGVKLADQVLVKLPVSLTLLTASGLGYVTNVTAEVVAMLNTWARTTSETLISDETAKKTATAAVSSSKAILQTMAVGAFAANQLGILPISAVLAAILFSLQVNLGTGGGRAYVAASLYSWYIAQPQQTQTKIDAAAVEYAKAAKDKAKPKLEAAAKELGPLLSKKGAATVNAFKSVAEACRRGKAKATDKEEAAPVEVNASSLEAAADDAPAAAGNASSSAAAEAALVSAEPVAAAAAVLAGAEVVVEANVPAEKPPGNRRATRGRPLAAASAAAAAFVPGVAAGQGSSAAADTAMKGGRRKTRKPKSKRRVTRRRKAQKILGTPVFIY